MKYLILSILLLFSACKTPEEQLAAFRNKNPQLFKDREVKTLDTTKLAEDNINKDFQLNFPPGTPDSLINKLFLNWKAEQGRLQAEIKILNGKLYFQGKCKDTTIVKEFITIIHSYNDSLLNAVIADNAQLRKDLKSYNTEAEIPLGMKLILCIITILLIFLVVKSFRKQAQPYQNRYRL